MSHTYSMTVPLLPSFAVGFRSWGWPSRPVQQVGLSREKTPQRQEHGRPAKDGLVLVMVTDIISKNKVESWQEYPTHSGEVEARRFVAWPNDYIRHQQSGHKPNASEAEVIKDDLHPDQFVSPMTIMSTQYLRRVPTFNICIRSKSCLGFFSANRLNRYQVLTNHSMLHGFLRSTSSIIFSSESHSVVNHRLRKTPFKAPDVCYGKTYLSQRKISSATTFHETT